MDPAPGGPVSDSVVDLQWGATTKEVRLPSGFSSQSDSKLAWTATEEDTDAALYIHRLTEEDHREIDSALAYFLDLELYGDRVNEESFPLPNLQHKLRNLSGMLSDGPGYIVIRGLNINTYSTENAIIVWLGIQSYIAEIRLPQDSMNNMLVHITCKIPARISHLASNQIRHCAEKIDFHTDSTGDVVAFLTRSNAENGGQCLVSSAYQVYNELATTRPDILQLLACPDWPHTLPYPHERALMFMHESKLIFNFNPLCMFGTPSHPQPLTLQSLSPAQRNAFDVLQRLSRKHSRTLATDAGDMHFINNLAVFHGREKFETDENHSRHIIRMNLRSNEWAWSLPEPLSRQWLRPVPYHNQRWSVDPLDILYYDDFTGRPT